MWTRAGRGPRVAFLDELERQGVVRKFRGGVTAQPSAVFESNVQYRLRTMRAEKAAVADRVRYEVCPTGGGDGRTGTT
ncbi:deoR family glycerol-3-phosphate regulon repressor [Streptomyces sp. NL15-2K]|nr:deoR family glycerol-3-phosphate regulon repressor [Streptomyces sp. NL15-2K]